MDIRDISDVLYNDFTKKISEKDILLTGNEGDVSPFSSKISSWYKNGLYVERSHLAHNLKSYKIDNPDLDSIQFELKNSYCFMLYFFVLILMDKVFVRLYKDYLTIVGKVKDRFY